jgi:hypothetical protein
MDTVAWQQGTLSNLSLRLSGRDPYGYACAQRVLPEIMQATIRFELPPGSRAPADWRSMQWIATGTARWALCRQQAASGADSAAVRKCRNVAIRRL